MSGGLFFGTVGKIVSFYGAPVRCSDIYSGAFAAYYDTLPASEDEIEAYTKEAFSCGRDVLELCCGNGRLTAEFAARGFYVDGVDLSADMLARLEKRKSRLSPSAARRIRIKQENVLDLDETKTYDFILLPATTICLFSDDEYQTVRLLEKVSRLLKPEGRFMFDMRVYPDGNGTEFSPVQVDTMTLDGEKAMVILQEQLDYRSGYAVGNFYLQKTDGGGRMEQWAAATRKKIVPEQEMERRIGQSGLQILDKTRARIWDSSVVYYCLGKQKRRTEEEGL